MINWPCQVDFSAAALERPTHGQHTDPIFDDTHLSNAHHVSATPVLLLHCWTTMGGQL